MKKRISRRGFLAASAAAGLGMAAGGQAGARETPFKHALKKALICNKPEEEHLKKLKDAGFDGVETGAWNVPPDEAAKAREMADRVGMKIHSVLRGWMLFNSPDAAVVAKSVAETETALRAAQGYGADAVLLVPCRIGGMAMPEAWEFDIAFDPKTGHVSRVTAGDNAKYQAYLDAQNQATDSSCEAVKRLIPVAEKASVVIALENVWNNLWVKPEFFAWFVKSFENPWVKAYLDLGNHVKYAPAEAWVRALGRDIAKCHVKDFKLNADGHGGNFCNIRDGSVNWPVVRQTLDDVGYGGWMTIEGGDCSIEEHSKRLNLILAGE